MQSRFLFFLLVCGVLVAQAQNDSGVTLNIGLPAPPLRVREWLKGKPIQNLEKGRIYVVEFWSTWCGACIEEMPRLSALARQYRRKVTFIGVNIFERKTPPQVKSFVDSMQHWMRYTVAAQDSNFMENAWMEAAGEYAIPASFVVDAQGRLAWIGYTAFLPDALSKIVANKWDLTAAKTEHDAAKHLNPLDLETFHTVDKYTSNAYMKDFFGDPDSALLLIDKAIAAEPGLKYGYFVAVSTIHAWLRKDAHQAYEYAKAYMATKDADYECVIRSLKDYPYQYSSLPKEMFELGAEACQAEIDKFPWSTSTYGNYLKMAEWYLLADNKQKAKKAMRNAIKALKRKRKFIQRVI